MKQERVAKSRSRSGHTGRVRGEAPAGFRTWVSAGLGAFILIVSGFSCGVALGVFSEEPSLVASHLIGQSDEVVWSAEPGVSAPPAGEPLPARRDLASELPHAARSPDRQSLNSNRRQAGLAHSVALDTSPVAAVGPPAERGWTVQVGAFSSSLAADTLVESLEAKGFRAHVTPSAASADGRWRVRVGRLSDEREAQRLAQRLESEASLATWVIPEGGG